MIYIGLILIVVGIISVIVFSHKKREKQLKLDHDLLCTVTNEYRGTLLERVLVLDLLKHGIPNLTIFHDLYVSKKDGGYAQIDMVVVTSVGIIVIEVKDYSGWIYGNGGQQKWTQVLAQGREKYRFYNPIIQNKNHIFALRGLSRQFYNLPYFNVVVFSNRCNLQELNFIPHETYVTKANRLLEVIEKIKLSNHNANYSNKREVIDILKQMVWNGNKQGIQKEHIKDIEDKMGKERIFD